MSAYIPLNNSYVASHDQKKKIKIKWGWRTVLDRFDQNISWSCLDISLFVIGELITQSKHIFYTANDVICPVLKMAAMLLPMKNVFQ